MFIISGCIKLLPVLTMPIFCITALERILSAVVNETTSSNFNIVKAYLRDSLAASVAYPLPQYDLDKRQPISTQGENGKESFGICRPTKPINFSKLGISIAQNPQPRSCISDWILPPRLLLFFLSFDLGKIPLPLYHY